MSPFLERRFPSSPRPGETNDIAHLHTVAVNRIEIRLATVPDKVVLLYRLM